MKRPPERQDPAPAEAPDHSQPLSDEVLDSLLPAEGFEIIHPPAGAAAEQAPIGTAAEDSK